MSKQSKWVTVGVTALLAATGLGLVGCQSQQQKSTHQAQHIERSFRARRLSRSTVNYLNEQVSLLNSRSQQTKRVVHRTATHASFNAHGNVITLTLPPMVSGVVTNKHSSKADQDKVTRLFVVIRSASQQLSRNAHDKKLGIQVVTPQHQPVYLVQNGHVRYSHVYIDQKMFNSLKRQPSSISSISSFV